MAEDRHYDRSIPEETSRIDIDFEVYEDTKEDLDWVSGIKSELDSLNEEVSSRYVHFLVFRDDEADSHY